MRGCKRKQGSQKVAVGRVDEPSDDKSAEMEGLEG